MLETFSLFFIITSLLIIITPGQDMVLVVSRSIAGGPRAGISTAAGVSLGLMGHTLLATLGLGALLSTSVFLFTLIKIVGAMYLVYLGCRMIFSKSQQLEITTGNNNTKRKLFYQGMISNISNPKITLFYFAFLPQFLTTQVNNHAMQFFILGSAFAILTFLIKAPLGYFAGLFSTWLRSHPKVITFINRISGTLLVALGFRLAYASQE